MGKSKPETFSLMIHDYKANRHIVYRKMQASGVEYELVGDPQEAGSYGDSWARGKITIRTKSRADAKRLRHAIGCGYMGIGQNLYQIGGTYFKRGQIKENKGVIMPIQKAVNRSVIKKTFQDYLFSRDVPMEQLADAVGVTSRTLKDYLDKGYFRFDVALSIARYLNADFDTMFGPDVSGNWGAFVVSLKNYVR